MLGAPYTEKANEAVFTAFSTSKTASLSKSESLEGAFSCTGDVMARRACGADTEVWKKEGDRVGLESLKQSCWGSVEMG